MSTKEQQMIALISVTNKSGLIPFAKNLVKLNFKILSTGGTAKELRASGIPVTDVSDYTASPEILDGRVKTLHPKIHAGILVNRNNPNHILELKQSGAVPIDLLVVNLYDFKVQAAQKNLPLASAIEFVDVGGPTMLRAAAKNHEHCLPVVDPMDYEEVIERIESDRIDTEFRQTMALKVFRFTSSYDQEIADFFANTTQKEPKIMASDLTPTRLELKLTRKNLLRYGENPHQQAALYVHQGRTLTGDEGGLTSAQILQGKELSYNNYLDLQAGISIVADIFPIPSMTIIKHTNPCGTAAGEHMTANKLFEQALSSDPKCAFGGIVATNVPIDEQAALPMAEIFLECIIAPDFSEGALKIFQSKKNLRLLKSKSVQGSHPHTPVNRQIQSISGGFLVQSIDPTREDTDRWSCVTTTKPNQQLLNDLWFAMTVCKHVKSNSIVLAAGMKSIGIGAGQMSRIDSVKIAISKARELGHVVSESVLASDAFFPFSDCVEEAAKYGIKAIVQPGGSLRDQESIDAANEHGIVMLMTGIRHFKH